MRPLTYALFTLFGVTVIGLQGCQDQTSTASTTEPTASSTEQTSTASTTEPTASSTEQTSTTSTTEPTASSTDSDSNNTALLPVKTQVDPPLVFCGHSKGNNINAATCADCPSCGGDCHMVGDACVDGESACTFSCGDCGHYISLSCQTYLSFRDEEKCQRCGLPPERCVDLTAEQCNYGSCSLKEGHCVACADDLAEEQCSKKKLQGYCTRTLDDLPAHQCKKTCDLCGTSLRGIGEKCEVRTGPSTPHCAHTTMCVTENTNEQCKFGAKNCICVKEKDVGDDCGHTNGPPYKCIRSSACLVTATNDKCGENTSTNTCSCVKIRDNGKDCGNRNGPPYPCIHQDLCVVTTRKTTSCSKNASKGSCSCFRPTCASTGHTCQLPSSRKKAADNYSCDAKSQKCTDKICCTSTTATTTKKTTKDQTSTASTTEPTAPSAVCMEDPPAICLGFGTTWYYDQAQQKCVKAQRGGCSGSSKNNFPSENECAEMCTVCMLDKESGPCRGFFTKWHYDKNEQRCKEFVYGGCDGNENNFATKVDCAATCEIAKGSNNKVVVFPSSPSGCTDDDGGLLQHVTRAGRPDITCATLKEFCTHQDYKFVTEQYCRATCGFCSARSVTTEENGSPGMTILMACIMGGVALAVMTIGVGAFFYNKREGEKKCKIGVLPQE